MRIAFILIAFLFFLSPLQAQTTISGGSVSGHWQSSGSPYLIQGNLFIPQGDSLIIDAGVQVVFMGHYTVAVSGKVKTNGTATERVVFRVQDTTGFTNDTSSAGGWGGFYFTQNGDAGSCFLYTDIRDCKYGSGTAQNSYGAAIYSLRPLTLANCRIYHCRNNSLNSLGCILRFSQYQSNFLLYQCEVFENLAIQSILHVETGPGATNTIEGCVFSKNVARYPIRIVNSPASVLDNDIHNNISVQFGGALNIQYGSQAIVQGNRIHYNTSGAQAAVVAIASVVDINGNKICNNKSGTSTCGLMDGGAGISVSNNGGPGVYLIRNNLIANNRSDFMGGGIYALSTDVDIFNNTIVNNSAPSKSGIFISGTNVLARVKNNVLYGNQNTSNSGFSEPSIYLYEGSLKAEHNWTRYPITSEVSYYSAPVWLGDTSTNIHGANAMLMAPTLAANYLEDAMVADFSLTGSSPCLDAGDTTGAAMYPTDILGNPRFAGSGIDIGAYEHAEGGMAVPGPSSSAATLGIFPNPASSLLYVSVPNSSGVVQVLDASGRLLIAQEASAMRLLKLDVSSLPAGSYFIQFKGSRGEAAVGRFVKE